MTDTSKRQTVTLTMADVERFDSTAHSLRELSANIDPALLQGFINRALDEVAALLEEMVSQAAGIVVEDAVSRFMIGGVDHG